jgi:hypothetical protein
MTFPYDGWMGKSTQKGSIGHHLATTAEKGISISHPEKTALLKARSLFWKTFSRREFWKKETAGGSMC